MFRVMDSRDPIPLYCLRTVHGQHCHGRWPAGARGPEVMLEVILLSLDHGVAGSRHPKFRVWKGTKVRPACGGDQPAWVFPTPCSLLLPYLTPKVSPTPKIAPHAVLGTGLEPDIMGQLYIQD